VVWALCACAASARSSGQSSIVLSSRPSQASATRSICSSSLGQEMKEVSSSTTGSSPWSSRTAIILSSDGLEPASGSVTCGSAVGANAKRIGTFDLEQIGEVVEGNRNFGIMDRHRCGAANRRECFDWDQSPRSATCWPFA